MEKYHIIHEQSAGIVEIQINVLLVYCSWFPGAKTAHFLYMGQLPALLLPK